MPSRRPLKIDKHFPFREFLLLPFLLSIAACSDVADNSAAFVINENSVVIGVLGDAPYQPEDIAEFPELVASINADPDVNFSVHVGDIKAGATPCTDASLQNVYNLFQTFDEPLIYSIGDNEWTDCDRPSAGSFDPEERLSKVREIFFSVPGMSSGGASKQVEAQPSYPENQLWEEEGIVFATLHVVGTNNNLISGAGIPGAAEQTSMGSSEYGRRNAANIAWMRGIFSRAMQNQSAGVALFLHADMWKMQDEFNEALFGGFREFVTELSIQAEAFSRPVLVVSGDNHRFRVDEGVAWFSNYGVSPVSNITQIVVQQGVEFFTNTSRVRSSWLKLIADANDPNVFQWKEVRREYVPFAQ